MKYAGVAMMSIAGLMAIMFSVLLEFTEPLTSISLAIQGLFFAVLAVAWMPRQ